MSLEVKLPFQSMLHVLTYSWISKATQVFGISSWEEVIFLSLIGFFFLLGGLSYSSGFSFYLQNITERNTAQREMAADHMGPLLACWALKFGQNPKSMN